MRLANPADALLLHTLAVQPACATPAWDGLEVTTANEPVQVRSCPSPWCNSSLHVQLPPSTIHVIQLEEAHSIF